MTCGSATNITPPITTPAPAPQITTKTAATQASSSPVDIPTPNNTTESCRTPKQQIDSNLDDVEVSSPSSSSGSPLDETSNSPSKLKKRNRCYSCKKKVGLTGKRYLNPCCTQNRTNVERWRVLFREFD